MPSSAPLAFGTVIIDAKTLYQSSIDRIRVSHIKSESASRDQLLKVTGSVKRIVVEHKPRNLLVVHTEGYEQSLPTDERQTYAKWRELMGVMGVPEAEAPRKSLYGFIGKAINSNTPVGRPSLIVSTDGLLGALLSENVFYEDAMDLGIYNSESFRNEYGFSSSYLTDFYGMVGHEELGVKGIDFIGPRKASEWLSGIQGNTKDHIKRYFGETRLGKVFLKNEHILTENLKVIERAMSYPSAGVPSMQPMIDRNHALHEHYQSSRVMPYKKELREAFEKHELFEILPKSKGGSIFSHEGRLSAIEAINYLTQGKSISLYFENDPKTGEVVGIGVSDGKLSHGFPLNQVKDYDLKWLVSSLKKALSKDGMAVVANDAKTYYKVFGNGARPLHADVSVLSYAINSGNGRSSFVDLAKRFTPDLDFNHAPYLIVSSDGVEPSGKYLAERANTSLLLNRRLFEASRGTPALRYYSEIEQPVAKILAKMDMTGIRVDKKVLKDLEADLLHKQQSILSFINKRLPSAEQVQELSKPKIEHLLFNVFGLKPLEVTAKGARSIKKEVLEQLEEMHWLPGMIREYRSVGTLLENTLGPMLKRLEGGDVIYPTFNQCVTITGRLSATDPNVQGIPARSEDGARIRKAFIGKDSKSIVSADYSQIELRILAHMSRDEGLIHAFKSGADPHASTASRVFGVDETEVTKEQRSAAKEINFGIIYGLTPFGLARRLGVDKDEASKFIDRYFQAFPGVKQYLDHVSKEGVEKGYVDTLNGRRISLFAANKSVTRREISEAERRACNYPMQGTAAEIVKRAMVESARLLENEFPDANLLMQVHDELVFEVTPGREKAFSQRIKEVMVASGNLCVPMEVDIKYGPSWHDDMEKDQEVAIKQTMERVSSTMSP